MDRKVWKYYQKSYKKEKLQNSIKLVSTVSPANFGDRLRTSLVGIATSSLAHAKSESGRLKIRNIAHVNTRQFFKKTLGDQRQPETIKSQPSLKKKKNVFELLLWSTHITYIWVYLIFFLFKGVCYYFWILLAVTLLCNQYTYELPWCESNHLCNFVHLQYIQADNCIHVIQWCLCSLHSHDRSGFFDTHQRLWNRRWKKKWDF